MALANREVQASYTLPLPAIQKIIYPNVAESMKDKSKTKSQISIAWSRVRLAREAYPTMWKWLSRSLRAISIYAIVNLASFFAAQYVDGQNFGESVSPPTYTDRECEAFGLGYKLIVFSRAKPTAGHIFIGLLDRPRRARSESDQCNLLTLGFNPEGWVSFTGGNPITGVPGALVLENVSSTAIAAVYSIDSTGWRRVLAVSNRWVSKRRLYILPFRNCITFTREIVGAAGLSVPARSIWLGDWVPMQYFGRVLESNTERLERVAIGQIGDKSVQRE